MKLLKNWWLLSLRGLFLIVIGILAFAQPLETNKTLMLFLGIGLVISGLFQVVAGIEARKLFEDYGWIIAQGLFDVVFGIIISQNPKLTGLALAFLVGFWLIALGIMVLMFSFRVRRWGVKMWWTLALGGVLVLLCGLGMMRKPESGAIVLTWVFGFGAIMAGLANLSLGNELKKAKDWLHIK